VAEDTGQERTEQATERRREETRKRGQVARSIEINSAFILLVGFFVLLVFRKHIVSELSSIMRGFFTLSSGYTLHPANAQNLMIDMMGRYFTIMLPMFVILAAAGILINVIQVGFLFTGYPLVPRLDKIDPLQGIRRMFSRRSFETLIRNILKIVVVGWIAYTAVKGMIGTIMGVAGSSAPQVIAFTGKSVFSITMKILIGYGILAVIDYAFQRWDYEKSMMMTRQEIREELKHLEGDPLLRARIRSVQREMARRRMMEEVPKAEVVITNPTEIAVAIRYDPGIMAPIVIAKGRKLIAERIRIIAAEAGVPIVENVTLAQALYRAVDIGHFIPGDLFTAVAEVLAYVYQLKGKKVV